MVAGSSRKLGLVSLGLPLGAIAVGLALLTGSIGASSAGAPKRLAPATAPSKAGGGAPTAQFTRPYSPAMHVERHVWTYLGKRTVDVVLVNPTQGADLVETARQCLRQIIGRFEFAQCYVFDSREEYEYKNLGAQMTPETREAAKGSVGAVVLCWAVLGRREAGKPATIADMRDAPQTWKSQGCPGW